MRMSLSIRGAQDSKASKLGKCLGPTNRIPKQPSQLQTIAAIPIYLDHDLLTLMGFNPYGFTAFELSLSSWPTSEPEEGEGKTGWRSHPLLTCFFFVICLCNAIDTFNVIFIPICISICTLISILNVGYS